MLLSSPFTNEVTEAGEVICPENTGYMVGRTGIGAHISPPFFSDPCLTHSAPRSPPTSEHTGTHRWLTSNHFSGFSSELGSIPLSAPPLPSCCTRRSVAHQSRLLLFLDCVSHSLRIS